MTDDPVRIDRRGVLKGAGAALALAACGPRLTSTTSTTPRDPKAQPIVVVGAGLSGLVIAYRLMQRGYNVTVIEAGARPGGRIRTVRGWPDGLYVEAGAMHLVPDPELVKLLVELGVEVGAQVQRPTLASVVYEHGERRVYPAGDDRPSTRAYTAEERTLGFMGRLVKYFGIVGEIDDGMLRSMQWSADVAKLDAMTCAEYMRSNGASPAALSDLDEMLPIGDGIESISALEAARVLAAIDHERKLPSPVKSNGRVVGGAEAIPLALARTLGNRIAYETVLEHIDRGTSPVALTVRDRQGRHQIEAARVVLTMPFTVLRSIGVSPAWSPRKARAIAELGMTSVTRVWVASDRRYWIERGEAGRAESDLPTGRLRDESELLPGTAGILGVYATGAAAHRLAALDGGARIEALTADVARIHPAVAGHIVHGDSVAWETEPYARGAYAAFRPGQLTSLMPAAIDVEGAIHFAGCGTSYRPGFMHGAVASAARVVDEIVATSHRDSVVLTHQRRPTRALLRRSSGERQASRFIVAETPTRKV